MASKLPYYKLYPSDFDEDDKVLHMTLAEVGLYQLSLNCQWKYGSIPDNPEALAFLIRKRIGEVRRAWPMVRPRFKPSGEPGKLVNPRLEIERQKAVLKADQATGAAAKRWKDASTPAYASASKNALQKKDFSVMPRAYDSDSDSKKESAERKHKPEFCESAYLEFERFYPAKGRSRKIDSRTAYLEQLINSADPEALHAHIMQRMQGVWAVSEKWAKGFVMRMDEFIRNESWDEDPPRAGESGAPDPYTNHRNVL